LGSDQHVVSVKSKVYLSNNNQFQFTESRHKLEKFKFLDFSRRRPK
ncbi:trehalose operon repressor, partial [Pseudomonas aeruginosa]|nr:trehalose operon repressor [Pseudomonas aeruginosa]